MNIFNNPFQKAMQPYLEIQKTTKVFQELMNTLHPVIEIQKQLQIINNLQYLVPKLPENAFIKHAALMQEAARRFQEHIKNTPDYLLLIAKHGWFIDMDCDIPFPDQIADLIKSGNIKEADDALMEYFSENKETIFNVLRYRHPQQANLMDEIEFSLQSERYAPFITMALPIIDGICNDATSKKFFIKNRDTRLPEVLDKIDTHEDSIMSIYLTPIRNEIPINASEKRLQRFPCKLNRHEIIHGINNEYGTRINALKILSLLKYISDILCEARYAKKKK